MDRLAIIAGTAQEVRLLELAIIMAIPGLVLAPHKEESGG
jgi:hypothetical protein